MSKHTHVLVNEHSNAQVWHDAEPHTLEEWKEILKEHLFVKELKFMQKPREKK